MTARLAQSVPETSGGSGDDPLLRPRRGWRYESYHDVVVEVPEAWDYDRSPSMAWCIKPKGLPAVPYVDTARPYDVVPGIGCRGFEGPEDPQDLSGVGVPRRYWTTHVSFAAPAGPDGTAADGTWTRTVETVGATQITVLAERRHAATAAAILDSARRVSTDHNGCDASSPIQEGDFARPSTGFDVASVATVDSISVCQYDLGRNEGVAGLIGSRRITGDDASNMLGAIKEAPVGGGPDEPENCSADLYGDTAVVLRLHHGGTPDDMHVYYEWCFGNGFDDGTNVRRLTQANCIPLFAPPVKFDSGSSAPFQRCHEDIDGGTGSSPSDAQTTSTDA
ncbi:MAG: hypothetical protein M3337_06025 [Actinomycetota bacterium]|nr:hypothetical protein [Actinomycetota bacterium]